MKNKMKVLFVLFTVKVGIVGRTIPQFLIYVRNIIDKLTGNPDYPDVVPTVPDLENNFERMVQAQEAAQKGGVLETMRRDEVYKELGVNVNRVAAYAEWKTGGDPVKLAELGFDVRKLPAPIGQIGAPQNFKAVSNSTGIVKLSCNKVRGAKIYVYEMTDDIAGGNWKMVGQSDTKLKLDNLPSGKQFWFRCYAIGASGNSPSSDVAVTFVQ